MATTTLKSPAIISRIMASTLGVYGFVWGFIVLGISIGLSLGIAYSEVQMLMFLLAFLLFLVLFLWSYSTKSLWRLWAILAGGGATMTCTAWFLTQTLS